MWCPTHKVYANISEKDKAKLFEMWKNESCSHERFKFIEQKMADGTSFGEEACLKCGSVRRIQPKAENCLCGGHDVHHKDCPRYKHQLVGKTVHVKWSGTTPPIKDSYTGTACIKFKVVGVIGDMIGLQDLLSAKVLGSTHWVPSRRIFVMTIVD